jgi:uncharacterized membrane protein YkoI
MANAATVNAEQSFSPRHRRLHLASAVGRSLIYVSDLSGHNHHYDKINQAHHFMRMHFRAALLCLALAAMIAPLHGAKADSDDHDSVREAVERGEIHSLADILAAVRSKLPGKIAGVEIEREGGRWVYEFRVVNGKGRLFDVSVDARTATIEQVKEK